MTVTSTTARRIHEGNDSATVFSFDFPITAPDDLVATLTDASGAETPLVRDLDYAVSVAAFPGAGSVTCPLAGPPLAAGTRLTLQRLLTIDQQIDLQNQGNFYAETHEAFFDRVTMICQQLADAVGRAAKLPVASTLGSLFFPQPAAGRAILWNAAGDGLANGPSADEVVAAQGHAASAAASASSAAASAGAAAAGADAAAASAAAVALPAALAGRGGDWLRVRADEAGYEHRAPAEARSDLGALPAADPGTPLILAGGAVAPVGHTHLLDTEGQAASDELERIDAANLGDGALLFLAALDAARSVVVRHAAGAPSGSLKPVHLAGGADLALDDAAKWLLLKRRGEAWQEVARSTPGAAAQPVWSQTLATTVATTSAGYVDLGLQLDLVAPPSGRVLVWMTTNAAVSAPTNPVGHVRLRETVAGVTYLEHVLRVDAATVAAWPLTLAALATGLTPGGSYSFRLQGKASAGSTLTVQVSNHVAQGIAVGML